VSRTLPAISLAAACWLAVAVFPPAAGAATGPGAEVVPPTGTTSVAPAEVPGLQVVTVSGPSNSNDFHSVIASCPSGKELIGAGYQITGATGEAVVDDFRPNGGPTTAPTSVFVGAYEAEAFAGNWYVTAYAVCANPLPGLVRITSIGATNSNDFHSVTASCPSGKVLTGSGYEMNGVTGEGIVDDFVPSGGTAVAPTSVFVGAYEAEAFAGNWNLRAYAICANPVPGLVRSATVGATNSNDFHSTSTSCPSGKVLTSGGFQITGATGEAVVDDFVPLPTLNYVGAYEEDPLAANWRVDSFAICATA